MPVVPALSDQHGLVSSKLEWSTEISQEKNKSRNLCKILGRKTTGQPQKARANRIGKLLGMETVAQ